MLNGGPLAGHCRIMTEAHYLHGHHRSVLDSHRRRTAANSAGYLLPHLRPGMSLLDVGAGAGTITADLADLLAPGTVTATEVDEQVLDLVRAALSGRRNVAYAVADVHALPFGDDTFDVTHAHQVLQHVADPVQALRELGRVTRPGGLIAVRDADYAGMFWYPESQRLSRWRSLYRELARAAGGEPDAARRLLGWAHAAGLREARPGAGTWCFATPQDRAWWADTWARRVEESTFARRALAHGRTPEELADLAAGWRAWGVHPDGWFLIPHGHLLITV